MWGLLIRLSCMALSCSAAASQQEAHRSDAQSLWFLLSHSSGTAQPRHLLFLRQTEVWGRVLAAYTKRGRRQARFLVAGSRRAPNMWVPKETNKHLD